MLEEITTCFHKDLDKMQISPEVVPSIEKIYRSEDLSEQELDMLLNASETAAVLSVKYRKPVNARYVRELTRDFVNKETGHVTPARLEVARKVARNAQFYRMRDVLTVKMR